MLHDTVEDAEPPHTPDAIQADILRDFGARVADGVEALTKSGSGSKTEQMRDLYREESKEILAELGSASPGLCRRFEQKLEEYRTFCRGTT